MMNNPQMMTQWHQTMMGDPQAMQQMHDIMASNPQHMQSMMGPMMNTMMGDPTMQQQMMDTMIGNQGMMSAMMQNQPMMNMIIILLPIMGQPITKNSDVLSIINSIEDLLDQTSSEYSDGNQDIAFSLATTAYLENYEYIEGTIASKNLQLIRKIELMMRVDLRNLIQNGEPA